MNATNRVRGIIILAVLTALASLARSGRASDAVAPDTLTDEQVRAAIRAIVEELHERKNEQRFWEPARTPRGESTRQEGGYTALVVLALLHAGEHYQDPRLKGAIDWLTEFDMRGTYARALRAAIWAKLPPKYKRYLAADAKWLIDGFSPTAAGWDYVQNPNTRRQDNSIRQFGALGLWEAAKRGARIDPRLWNMIEHRLIELQFDNGGWNYDANGPVSGSMTAAGLATLFITQDLLYAEADVDLDSTASARNRAAIEQGTEWMRRNFTVRENPGRLRDYFYYLYAVERAGLAGGVKRFGEHDWFREGAAEIINRLCAWDELTATMRVHETMRGDGRLAEVRTRHLAFGLLFLSRGRVPIAINKLAIDSAPWNNRPRDVANLTDWIRSQTETALNWQIVPFSDEPEQWLDAPMLYLASDEGLPWIEDLDVDPRRFKREVREFLRKRASGEIPMDAKPPALPDLPEMHRIKRYLDLGGMLFAVNEGRTDAFADSVRAIGDLMYPQYEWQRVANDHWAYTIHEQVGRGRPPLLALSNGVRELVILVPGADLAASLQSRDHTRKRAHFETATNLYFYASEINRPRPRLDRHALVSSSHGARESVTVVRAIHGGNWKPEPRALSVFESWLVRERRIELRIVDHPLHAIDELEPRPPLVLVSGVEAIELDRERLDAIEAYVRAGGFVLLETPGGVGDFTANWEKKVSGLFESPITALLRHALVTGDSIEGAADLARVAYRPYTFEVLKSRETTTRLRGIMIDGEPRILFSREDITHGLLDQPCWGISGYAPEDARNLLANVVQYAAAHAEKGEGE